MTSEETPKESLVGPLRDVSRDPLGMSDGIPWGCPEGSLRDRMTQDVSRPLLSTINNKAAP